MSLIVNKGNDNFYPISILGVSWKCDYLFSIHRGCNFDCLYCSSKRLNKRFKSMGDPTVPRRLKGEWTKFPNSDNEYLKRFILPNAGVFISPYNDIMTIPDEDINSIFGKIYDTSEYWFDRDVIGHKEKSQFNVILQTKNPTKYFDYLGLIPEDSWLGTTIETDSALYCDWNISKAPRPEERYFAMAGIPNNFNKYVTIEPVMKMNNLMKNELLDEKIIYWIKNIKPRLVFLGCDTGKNNLPEPTNDELIALIYGLYDAIGVEKVFLKKNIRRIIPAFYDGWKLAGIAMGNTRSQTI